MSIIICVHTDLKYVCVHRSSGAILRNMYMCICIYAYDCIVDISLNHFRVHIEALRVLTINRCFRVLFYIYYYSIVLLPVLLFSCTVFVLSHFYVGNVSGECTSE